MGDITERIGRRVSDTERLKPFLQAVKSYSPDLIFGVEQQLFHYTDLSGFQGIVTNHDLWLSHLRYSNDEEEMVHGQRLVMEVIDDKRKTARSSKRTAFLKSVRKVAWLTTGTSNDLRCACDNCHYRGQIKVRRSRAASR